MIRNLILAGLFAITIVLTQPQVVLADVGVPSQTTSYPHTRRLSEVKELPTTGIPALAWALVGLIPLGKKLSGYGRDKTDSDNPQSILQKKLFIS